MEQHLDGRRYAIEGGLPADRQLAEPHDGLVGRLLDQTKGLTQDLSALVELRIKKAQIDIEERIDRKLNDVTVSVIFAILLALGGFFLLIAASLGLGELLGHPAWGFVVVGIVLGITGYAVRRMRPGLVEVGSKKAVVNEEKLVSDAPVGRPHLVNSST